MVVRGEDHVATGLMTVARGKEYSTPRLLREGGREANARETSTDA